MMENKDIANLTSRDVLRVYSGRPGCCCGCRGTYRCPSDPEAIRLAGERRGYPVGEDEVNDRQVTRVLNLLKRSADACEIEQPTEAYAGHVHLNTGSRWYIAYLR